MSATTPERGEVTVSSRTLAARLGGLDYPLVAILATLLTVGLIEVWSASLANYGTTFFTQQIVWVLLGGAVLMAMAATPYRLWQRLAVPVMLITLLLLVAVLVFGHEVYGAKRTLFGGRLQPSEFTKLTVVIYVAAWVASKRKHLRDVKVGLVPFAIVMGVVSGLVLLEKSVSMTIIILVTGITIFFVGGGDVKQLLIAGILTAVVLVLVIWEFHYGIQRINDWWTALVNPNDAPYSVAQVREVILRGGGIGSRPENWLNRGGVPLLWSDYLFANLAADTKFLGAVSVVVLFAALGYRGLSIALSAPDEFGALSGIGVTTWILTQAVIHMGTSVALIPATGIPLPFMSYGGSAMLSCMAGVGLLLSISRATPEKKAGYETFRFGWGDGGPRVPDSGSGARAKAAQPAPRRAEPKKPAAKPAERRGGQQSPPARSGPKRRPASGPAGRWRPRTREEEFVINNDWRSRVGDRQLPKRRRPAPNPKTTRR